MQTDINRFLLDLESSLTWFLFLTAAEGYEPAADYDLNTDGGQVFTCGPWPTCSSLSYYTEKPGEARI